MTTSPESSCLRADGSTRRSSSCTTSRVPSPLTRNALDVARQLFDLAFTEVKSLKGGAGPIVVEVRAALA